MTQNESLLMTIGEAATSLGVTRRMILNYEDKGLLKPDKKEGMNGNRYYTADSLSRIRTIRVLQDLGLSLDEIKCYYDGKTDLVPLIARLEKLRDELTLNIEKLKERVKGETDYEIRTVTIPAQTIYRQTVETTGVEVKKEILREVFITAMKRYGTDTSKRMMFIEAPNDAPDLASYSIVVPEKATGEGILHLTEEKALSIFYHGAYEDLPQVRRRIYDHANEQGIALQGTFRLIFVEGPPQHKDPSKFITQVAVLIK